MQQHILTFPQYSARQAYIGILCETETYTI